MDTHPVAAAVLTGDRWTGPGGRWSPRCWPSSSTRSCWPPSRCPRPRRLPGGAARRGRLPLPGRPAAVRRLAGHRGLGGRRDGHGEAPATDPVRLLLDLRTTAGVPAATAAHLLKELRATQVADCHLAAGGASARRAAGAGPPRDRGRDGRPPLDRPQQGPPRLRLRRLPALRPGAAGPGAAALAGRPHRPRLLPGRPLAPPRPAPGRRARPGHRRRLHRHPGRHRRRSRRLPLVPGPRLAVAARGRAAVRAHPGRRRPGPPRPGARRVPAPAVDPHPDQPAPPRAATTSSCP